MPTLNSTPRPALFAALLGLALGSACVVEQGSGIDADTGLIAEGQASEQVIIGSVDWEDVGSLSSTSEERINSLAVGYLSIPAKGTRCTAFLINDDTVMTNEHCISSQADAQGATVAFRREAGVPWSEWASYTCSTYVGDSSALDFALLRCEGSPGQTHGVVELEDRSGSVGHSLYVIHQNCDYYSAPSCSPTKKISRGQITRIDSEVRHNADTLGGSSGSPVFSETSHKVFALHHVGVGNNGDGRGSYNYAVKMGDILGRLASHFPTVVLGGGSVTPPAPEPTDVFEPNNTTSSATSIATPFDTSDLNIGSEDVDVFEVTLPSAGTLEVAVGFTHADGDLDVTLHAGSTSNPAVAKADSADDNEVLNHDVAAGTYFVVVYGYNGARNAYDLNLALSGASEPEPTDPEPTPTTDDDSIETARTVGVPFLADYAIDAAGDEDFFRFTTGGGSLEISIAFAHSNGDLDLFLLDSAGQEIGSSTSVNNDEVVASSPAAGTYYVRVIGYGGATGDYSLELR